MSRFKWNRSRRKRQTDPVFLLDFKVAFLNNYMKDVHDELAGRTVSAAEAQANLKAIDLALRFALEIK